MPKPLIHREYLYSYDNNQIKDYSISSGSSVSSAPIRVHYSRGFSSILVELDSGTPSVNLTYQVSINGSDFYTPIDTDGTALNTIYTSLTTTSWISFAPQIAEYIRFNIEAVHNSTVSAIFIQQEN